MTTDQQLFASPGAGGEPITPPSSTAPGAGLSFDDLSLGYIKLFRKMTEWVWYQDSTTKSLFIHLLISANHKDGFWKGIKVKRGQCVVGRNSLSESLGISPQSIRTSISRLVSTNDITITSTNKFSIVTICNYDSYQSRETQINQPISQQANHQSTSSQPAVNHKQECKEVVIEREYARDASVPTLTDIKKLGQMVGFTDAQCEAFFNHYQGNNTWLNQFGRLMDVRKKMEIWKRRDEQSLFLTKGANGKSNRSNHAPADRNAGTYNDGTDGHEYDHLIT